MTGLTVCDWELALAAYAYSQGLPDTMSDASFDRMAATAQRRGTALPGFQAHTGMWVGAMDQALLERLYRAAIARNLGKDDLHQPAVRAALAELGIEVVCCRVLPFVRG